MKTMIVSGYGVRIGVEKGVLVVKDKNSVEKISIGDLDQVVIATSGVSISSKAIRVLLRHGVDIVFLDSRGLPAGRIWLPYLTKTTLTRRAQYEAYVNGFGLTIAKAMVWAKIMNQAGLLRRLARSTGDSELREESYRVESYLSRIEGVSGSLAEARGKLREIEACAARIYWSCLATILPGDIGFNGRDYESNDVFNISLNYLYAVAYTEAWRELVLAGLDPFAGYIHVDRSGKPSLVYDYIEMFRVSLVDYMLVKLYLNTTWRPRVDEGLLDREDRARLLKEFYLNLERKVKPRRKNQSMTLRQALRHYAYRLADSLRELQPYEGFVEKW